MSGARRAVSICNPEHKADEHFGAMNDEQLPVVAVYGHD
jgi:hypothetical protein